MTMIQVFPVVCLILATVFAFMRAFGVGSKVDLGWVAIGLVILAVALLPSLLVISRT